MWIITFFFGLITPRLTIAILWLFSGWFDGVFATRAWPILGFLFMPLTLLWFSVVEQWFQGTWNWWQILIVILLAMTDFGIIGKSAR